MNGCNHPVQVDYYLPFSELNNANGVHLAWARRCHACGEQVSIGPANDTPDALVELRAAEIAANERPICMAEQVGFIDYDNDGDPPPVDYAWNEPWQIGWLGRCISQHDANNEAKP